MRSIGRSPVTAGAVGEMAHGQYGSIAIVTALTLLLLLGCSPGQSDAPQLVEGSAPGPRGADPMASPLVAGQCPDPSSVARLLDLDRFGYTDSRVISAEQPGLEHVSSTLCNYSDGFRGDFTVQVVDIVTMPVTPTEFRRVLKSFQISEPGSVQGLPAGYTGTRFNAYTQRLLPRQCGLGAYDGDVYRWVIVGDPKRDGADVEDVCPLTTKVLLAYLP